MTKRAFLAEGLHGTMVRHVVLVAAMFDDSDQVKSQVDALREQVSSNVFVSRRRRSARIRSLSFCDAHPSSRREMRALISRLQLVCDVRFAKKDDVASFDEAKWYRKTLRQFAAAELVRGQTCDFEIQSGSRIDVQTATREIASLANRFERRESAAGRTVLPAGERIRLRGADRDDPCCLVAEYIAGTVHEALEAGRGEAEDSNAAYGQIASHIRVIRDVGNQTMFRGHAFLRELTRRASEL